MQIAKNFATNAPVPASALNGSPRPQSVRIASALCGQLAKLEAAHGIVLEEAAGAAEDT